VQEACEWWPGTENGTAFHAWMYREVMFRLSSGALVISHAIRDRIAAVAEPDYPVCMVPVLVNPEEYPATTGHRSGSGDEAPILLWCGMVDGYIRDVYFLIDALALVRTVRGRAARLRIVGPCSEIGRTKLYAHAEARGIDLARIEIAGFVSDEQLSEYCLQADALLMPLWNDDRSVTRFPTKLGQYLAAGRPIVTAQVGEIPYYLSEQTAVFYAPGNANSLAHALESVLADPVSAEAIAQLGMREVLPKVDCRENAGRIGSWFRNIGGWKLSTP
jgi:glycosyltransferase involved in cell wall biosynthesis